MTALLINSLLGVVVGVILALTGAGGGILAVPLLLFGAQLSMPQAAPIALLAVGMSAALGAVLGLKAGMVRYKASLLMAAAGMLLAPVGLWLAHRTDDRWLSVLFALILLFIAYRTFRRARDPLAGAQHLDAPSQACVRNAGSGRFIWTTHCARVLGTSGMLSGLLSGLLGVGGGFVLVPALQRYTDLDMASIVATSLMIIALISASGVVASALAGTLSWPVAVPFTVGSLIGMFGGRLVAARLAGAHLQTGFALVAATVALGMIAKNFFF